MSDNALDRLMNKRSRPKVPQRKDELESSKTDVKTTMSQDSKTHKPIDSLETKPQPVKTELPMDIKTVRSTTRIETSVDQGLRQLCLDEKLTKETWIEAAYLYLTDHPQAMSEVVVMAGERLQRRKDVADLKRALTMKERIEERLREG